MTFKHVKINNIILFLLILLITIILIISTSNSLKIEELLYNFYSEQLAQKQIEEIFKTKMGMD